MKKESAKQEVKYPAAELLQNHCFDDYMRLINTYDKIYDRINIALVFCGVLFVYIINNFNIPILIQSFCNATDLEIISLLILLSCKIASAVCILWATIQLLILTMSKSITVFDSIAARNEEVYRWSPDEVALWLIDKYTYAVSKNRKVVQQKQASFNSSLVKIIISIITFAFSTIIEKGVQL